MTAVRTRPSRRRWGRDARQERLGVMLFAGRDADPAARWYPVAEAVVLGRDAACAIQLDDDEVSRQHVRLAPADGALLVEDQGSHNGTFINGARVDDVVRVELHDVLRVGVTLLRVARGPDAPTTLPSCDAGALIGGATLRAVVEQADRAAPTRHAVLLLGETGTGKELLAQRIHQQSERPGPFVAVNCAAIPEGLIESELFGHVRGAFSGADRSKTGLVRDAAGGTLFLDEVADLPLDLQAKLLRVLQERRVRAVGGGLEQPVDIRVLCAANEALGERVRAGGFRADLFGRIAEITIDVPPLRERVEDVPLIARRVLDIEQASGVELPTDTLELLCCQRWPLNVRELRNTLIQALLHNSGRSELLPSDFPALLRRREMPDVQTRPRASDAKQHELTIALITRHRGDVAAAAREAGISASQFYRWLEAAGVKARSFRAREGV